MAKHRLIIFTRYPETGKTRTRLIPRLGEEGAAKLQHRLTVHTLIQARKFAKKHKVKIEIHYEGGNVNLMKQWLGDNLSYKQQKPGDLGSRMAGAFQESLKENRKTVIIGSDCPGISCEILQKAFYSLEKNLCVTGESADGGYYLIGLSQFVPELFSNISWGSDTVLTETLNIIKQKELSVEVLDTLSDIDRPEDLKVWEEVQQNNSLTLAEKKISVIIPALNEENNIGRTLESIKNSLNTEVIVVDGGSHDRTIEIAESYGVKVIESEAGRARQLNTGASQATGEILLFLHADTILPGGFDYFIRYYLQEEKVTGGAFQFKINDESKKFRFIEALVKLRLKLFNMPYGDQVIFTKKETFNSSDMFPDIPIMEDFEFVRKLQKKGKLIILPVPVLTSARRWNKLGVVRTTVINQIIIAGYLIGVPLKTLAKLYRSCRR